MNSTDDTDVSIRNPEVLRNRVANYCLGMPGVDGVTPWPPEVNLVDRLAKLEQEYNYLRNFRMRKRRTTTGNSQKRNLSRSS